MYILVSGLVALNKRMSEAEAAAFVKTQQELKALQEQHQASATRATSSGSVGSRASAASEDMAARVALEANCIEEKEFGKRIGVVNTPWCLFGERQLLFGEPWPVTVRGISSYKVLILPLNAVSQVILQRPEMLEGMGWLLEEETFLKSTNHVDLLLAMGQEVKDEFKFLSRAASPTDDSRDGGGGACQIQ